VYKNILREGILYFKTPWTAFQKEHLYVL
jgi:hypothetical protein